MTIYISSLQGDVWPLDKKELPLGVANKKIERSVKDVSFTNTLQSDLLVVLLVHSWAGSNIYRI